MKKLLIITLTSIVAMPQCIGMEQSAQPTWFLRLLNDFRKSTAITPIPRQIEGSSDTTLESIIEQLQLDYCPSKGRGIIDKLAGACKPLSESTVLDWLKNHPDIDATAKYNGATLLTAAAHNKYEKVLATILTKYVPANASAQHIHNTLMTLARKHEGSREAAEMLIRHGADCLLKDSDGYTLLTQIIKCNCYHMGDTGFLETILGINGKTRSQVLKETQSEPTSAIVERRNFLLSTLTPNGETPLTFSIKNNFYGIEFIVRCLPYSEIKRAIETAKTLDQESHSTNEPGPHYKSLLNALLTEHNNESIISEADIEKNSELILSLIQTALQKELNKLNWDFEMIRINLYGSNISMSEFTALEIKIKEAQKEFQRKIDEIQTKKRDLVRKEESL